MSKTSYRYKKNLKSKKIPVQMVYEGCETVEFRRENYETGTPRLNRLREISWISRRLTKTEERYCREIEVFAALFEKYDLNEGYRLYRRRSRKTDLTDYMSAQFATKIVAAIREGGLSIIQPYFGDPIEVDGLQNTGTGIRQPLYWMWIDRVSTLAPESDNTQPQKETELTTSTTNDMRGKEQ